MFKCLINLIKKNIKQQIPQIINTSLIIKSSVVLPIILSKIGLSNELIVLIILFI